MILSSILEFFLALTGLGQPTPPVLPNRVVEPASAAEVHMELYTGMEESLGISFNHSLPVVNAAMTFGPQRIPSDSLGILTSAQSAVVVDERTWSVLFDKQSNIQTPIASISKLMTALVLLDAGLDPVERVTISKADYISGGIIHFFSGEEVLMQDLWMTGLIASDNVAIAAMVRSTGLGTEEFVARMNLKARALGMENTSFVEPTGISEFNVSTATDVARLVSEAMKHREISDAVRRPVYTFEPLNKAVVRRAYTTNELLGSFVNKEPYTIRGGKTGFTNEAGYCLSVVVDGPTDADDVIVVLLGAPTNNDRFLEVKGLVDWVYANYEW